MLALIHCRNIGAERLLELTGRVVAASEDSQASIDTDDQADERPILRRRGLPFLRVEPVAESLKRNRPLHEAGNLLAQFGLLVVRSLLS